MSKKGRTEKIGKWESQVRKGMLDFIILICLEKREFYGYELIKAIKDTTEINVSEGTIYPLLNRLKNDEFITSKWVEMETGIPRKYYQLTPGGKKLLTNMKNSWKQFSSAVQQLMEEQ
ncbi:MAG: PadR family transcriptional regulator [Candidatus Aminicenantes bacterium]|jgi:PadR family transcriptional regulator PadR